MSQRAAAPGDVPAREISVEVAPGLMVAVLEPSSPDDWLDQAVRETDRDPYAGVLWPSALGTAAALVDAVAPGERVVDLGAGIGLAALTAARIGARPLALDHDPVVLELIERAAALQGLAVETRRFDLRAPEPLPSADVVVLADLLYEPALASAAAARVIEALDAGARVLVGDPGRLARSEFVRTLAAAGIESRFDDVDVRMPHETASVRVGIARFGI